MPKKTLIAVPCMDQVPALFAQSLALLQKPENTTLVMKMGTLIYTSRHELANMALDMDADYIFWMDSDMTFRQDCLMRMIQTLEENDLDILSGLYFRRVPPYTPVLFDRLEINGNICSWSEFKGLPEGLFEIGGCGFGCLLTKTDIFLDGLARYGNMFTPIGNNGEDIAFCVRAREMGYKIMCDPSMVCGHIGYVTVDDRFYNAYNGGK